MSTQLPRNVTASEGLICQQLDGEMVILDLQQEQYFGLNEVGSRMWQLLSEGRSTEEIVNILLAEFDTQEETLRRDLNALIQQLTDAKLLKIAG